MSFRDLFETVGVRDLFDIAREDVERLEQSRANNFLAQFEYVFNYRPDLGEPERDGSKRAWWVQGLLFSLVNGKLAVMTKGQAWVHIDHPRDLLRYEERLHKDNYDV